jgi:predicted RNA binding protein YcfA (HicA-like mRNA interferase family)
MPKLPTITGRQAIAAFSKHGFVEDRVCGSHHILKKDGHEFLLSVPVHGSENLKTGTLRGLIRASGLTVEQFCDLVD